MADVQGMGPSRYSRRAFLKVFTGKLIDTASSRIALALPNSSSQRIQVQDEQAARELNQSDAASSRCMRCYAPFHSEQDESLCPDCREADAKNQSLLNGLFHNGRVAS